VAINAGSILMRGTDQGGGVCRKTYLRDSIREEGLLEREAL
jgi:hypothetical protein